MTCDLSAAWIRGLNSLFVVSLSQPVRVVSHNLINIGKTATNQHKYTIAKNNQKTVHVMARFDAQCRIVNLSESIFFDTATMRLHQETDSPTQAKVYPTLTNLLAKSKDFSGGRFCMCFVN